MKKHGGDGDLLKVMHVGWENIAHPSRAYVFSKNTPAGD